jgi:hypothetical protein
LPPSWITARPVKKRGACARRNPRSGGVRAGQNGDLCAWLTPASYDGRADLVTQSAV